MNYQYSREAGQIIVMAVVSCYSDNARMQVYPVIVSSEILSSGGRGRGGPREQRELSLDNTP